MQKEYWDILDNDRNQTGKKVLRGSPMRQDEYHLVVDVWIKNSKDEFLISKRTSNKTYPGLCETTGGSAVTGDNSAKTALKEVYEELGLTLNPRAGKLIYQCKRQHKDFPDFLDVWLFTQDFKLYEVVCQPDEVSEAKWSKLEEIKIMIQEKTFILSSNYLDILSGHLTV